MFALPSRPYVQRAQTPAGRALCVFASCAWLLACVLVPARPARSQAPVALSQSIKGFGPDAQLTGGVGFGFGGKLDNYFLARARLGALYARAPFVANLGLTVDVGALAGLGIGGELELNHAGALFGSAGLARIDGERWLAHAGLGFTIFGLEWQHAFGGRRPHDALLFEVRVPLGTWWLHKREEKANERQAAALRGSQGEPRVVPSGAPPATAGAHSAAPPLAAHPSATAGPASAPGASSAASNAAASATANSQSATSPEELAARVADAQRARERGDRLAEALALSRAYALSPQPGLALQLAAAELSLGKPRSALADLQRAGSPESLPPEQRANARSLRSQIDAALAYLRLSLEGAAQPSDSVLLDGVAEPSATRGYDVPLDPGEHTVQLVRGQRVLIEQVFRAQPGKLVRLSLQLPDAGAPPAVDADSAAARPAAR